MLSVSTQIAGQRVEETVNLTGDFFGFQTAIAHGATEVTNVGIVPDTLKELVIFARVACTIECGDEDPITLVRGAVLTWHTGCGLDCPFTGAAVTQFTIVSTEASLDSTVDIAFKTTDS